MCATENLRDILDSYKNDNPNIIIWNIKDGRPPEPAIYCGRNLSIAKSFKLNKGMATLGNRFEIYKDGTRLEVIRKFEEELNYKVRSKTLTSEEREILSTIIKHCKDTVYLVCHCYPKRCHAESIKELVEKLYSGSYKLNN